MESWSGLEVPIGIIGSNPYTSQRAKVWILSRKAMAALGKTQLLVPLGCLLGAVQGMGSWQDGAGCVI